MTNQDHPKAIFLQLHTYCNAECINCPFEFTYNSIHQNGRMSQKTWNKILADIIEMDFKGQIGFYLHHEPLLDKTVYRKIREINERTNAYAVLSTNGQLLNGKNIDKLLEAKPKKIHMNINSGDKKEYESSMKGLKYETTIKNCRDFIDRANNEIEIEINCPVIEGFNVKSLKLLFPDVKVNLDYWANSRGGLLPEFFHENKGSRFKVDNYCNQPSTNLNILSDGSTIACCMDWMHETKKDYPNVNDSSILSIYNEIKNLQNDFENGDYSKYKMCDNCSKEMGFYRAPDKQLKILITNHHLLDYSGSEIYTYTLAKKLTQNGHEVTIYTKFFDKINHLFDEIDVSVITNADELKKNNFDIAHVHHNIMAIEVRYYFPSLPMIFLSHGVIPFLENPSIIDVGISRYLAVSEEVKYNLIEKGVNHEDVVVLRNIIDSDLFFPKSEIRKFPQKAMVLSNKINHEIEDIIKEACNKLNIELFFVGRRFIDAAPHELPDIINEVDIVFTLGRGVIESIMCGRIPVVFDRNGGDGLVNSENFHHLKQKNFSGRTENKIFTVYELVNEIKKYNSKDITKLRGLAINEYGNDNVKRIAEIYHSAIQFNYSKKLSSSDKLIAETIFNTIAETNRYNQVMNNRATKDKSILNYSSSENEMLKDAEKNIQMDDYLSAEKILIKVLNEINPDSVKAANNLAVVWILLQKNEEALDLLNQILEKNPHDEIAKDNQAYLMSVIEKTNTNPPVKTSTAEKQNLSIIIPVYNKSELTIQCLKSLNSIDSEVSYEVIIVDNASDDNTSAQIEDLKSTLSYPIRIIRNERNFGFAKGNNQGAENASFDNLLFLNNDTIAEHDFLSVPVEKLDHADIGAVGIKLLYPDNLIQHAGLVFGNKKLAEHIYNFYKSDYPEANIAKEVSAVTGACLFIKKEVFQNLGGFDEQFLNGQEDIDLCMKLKQGGLKIWYEPSVWIYHLESQSANRLDKAFQNRTLFLERWSDYVIPDTDKYYSNQTKSDNKIADRTETNSKSKFNIAIKIGVPSREYKNWGDIYFAESLKFSLQRMGHNAIIHYLDEWNLKDEFIDIVIHIKGLSNYQLKKHNINLIWIINHPELHTVEELNNYDVVFVASEEYYGKLKDKLTAPIYLLPQATDQRYFNPDSRYDKQYDVLFVGNNYEYKNNKCRKIISDILNTGVNYNLKIIGEKWEGFVDKKYLLKEFVPWTQLAGYYSKAKIVLNDHQESMRKNGFINNRTFDIAQTKSLQISSYVGGIEKFGIQYYKSTEDLKLKLDKFLNDDELREITAQKNYTNTKDCLFDHRAEDIIEKICNEKSIKSKINSRVLSNTTPIVSNPKVSIIMTTFNRPGTLTDAVTSVINQTYKDWELIVVNDGGEDVVDIINLFNNSRIKYFNAKKGGKSKALNYGIAKSEGQYIAYLDDDDIYYPNHLEVLVNYLEVHQDIKFVYSIAEEATLIKDNNQWREVDTQIRYAKQVSIEELRYMNHIPNLAALHHKELFDSAGMYDEELDVLIDWDMYRRLAQFTQPIFINVVTSKYFRRKSSDSNAKNQMTGLYFSNPVKYYKNRLRVTGKNILNIKTGEIPYLVFNITNKNKSELKLYLAKYDTIRTKVNVKLMVFVSCKVESDLLESITYAEKIGGLVVKGNMKSSSLSLTNIKKKTLSTRNIFIDSLSDLRVEYIEYALGLQKEFIHFSKKLKQKYPGNYFDRNLISDKKAVSVIIPTYNNWSYTRQCLDSIFSVSTNVRFEVIVIDNNSHDETRTEIKKYDKKYKNLKIYYQNENMGFSRANNFGSKKAEHSFLLFLNNDTVVKDFWLDNMLDAFSSEKNVGIVGAKLLYPETKLVQHAGIIISDRPHPIFPLHIFNNEDSDNPLVNVQREYQAVTGACLMIRKDLFNSIECFDEEFINGYEDIDLCFRIRDKGFKVIYNPKAEIMHYESKTEGRFHKVDHNVKLLHKKWEGKIKKDDISAMSKPQVSIIIPVHNQLAYTKQCVESIHKYTHTPYEIIIINNASNDGTDKYLTINSNLKVITNNENLGYPKAINQGINASNGKNIVLLNNDTIVTEGWLERLLMVKKSHKKVGLVGVYSNSISGLQLDKECKYKTILEMHRYAKKKSEERHSAWIRFPRIAFVCVLINGELIKAIGGLDERFTPGNFEDDDYCLRSQLAAYQSFIACDVFIHHFGSVSFSVDGKAAYNERIEKNRRLFIEKWGGTPEDIWIFGKSFKKNELFLPFKNVSFGEKLESAFTDIEQKDLDSALNKIKEIIKDFVLFDRSGYESVTLDDLLNIAGNISLNKNDLEEAKVYFEQQLEENPKSSNACLGLGEVFFMAELFKESKTMLEWAIAYDNQNQNADKRLTEVNCKLNLPEKHNSLLEDKIILEQENA